MKQLRFGAELEHDQLALLAKVYFSGVEYHHDTRPPSEVDHTAAYLIALEFLEEYDQDAFGCDSVHTQSPYWTIFITSKGRRYLEKFSYFERVMFALGTGIDSLLCDKVAHLSADQLPVFLSSGNKDICRSALKRLRRLGYGSHAR